MLHQSSIRFCIAFSTTVALIAAPMLRSQAEEYPGYLTSQSLAGWKDYGGILGVTVRQGKTVDLTVTAGERNATNIHISGEYVESVTPHGPADYAGIRAGDEILLLDGYYFDSVNTMVTYIAGQRPSHVADVAVERDGKLLSAKIPLASFAHPHAPEYDRSGSDALAAAVGIGAAVVAGCWMLGCFSQKSSGGSGGSGSPGHDDDAWKYRAAPAPSYAEPARPDTSTGCAWGDRSTGTCH